MTLRDIWGLTLSNVPHNDSYTNANKETHTMLTIISAAIWIAIAALPLLALRA